MSTLALLITLFFAQSPTSPYATTWFFFPHMTWCGTPANGHIPPIDCDVYCLIDYMHKMRAASVARCEAQKAALGELELAEKCLSKSPDAAWCEEQWNFCLAEAMANWSAANAATQAAYHTAEVLAQFDAGNCQNYWCCVVGI